MDLKAITKAVGTVVREHVSRAFKHLADRMDRLDEDLVELALRVEQAPEKGEPGEPGEPGPPGESVTVEDIWPLAREHVDAFLQSLPEPANGKDGADGRDGKDGRSVTVEDVEPLLKSWLNEHLVDLERHSQDVLQRAIDKIPQPKDGKDGRDGVDSDPQAVANCVIERLDLNGTRTDFKKMARDLVAAEVAKIPAPRDGRDGKDARPATDDEIHAGIERFFRANPKIIERVLESGIAEWALDFEKRAQALLQTAIDKIPEPKDGKDGVDGKDGKDGADGSDGKDGFTLDQFDAAMDDDGRTIRISLGAGDEKIERAFTLPVVLDRGVWSKDTDYQHGDGVTYSGSFWIAQRDKPKGKPGQYNKHWRLAVKKGQAGKSA